MWATWSNVISWSGNPYVEFDRDAPNKPIVHKFIKLSKCMERAGTKMSRAEKITGAKSRRRTLRDLRRALFESYG